MICPHCGFEAPENAAQCMSCGYALRPPELPPRRRSKLFMLIGVALLFLITFIVAVRGFGDQSATSVSFFGKRAHFDFGAQQLAWRADTVITVSMRNPARTPVCRLYGRFGTVARGARFTVMDSSNYVAWRAGARHTPLHDQPVSSGSEFGIQTEGAGLNFLLAIYPENPADSATARIESMRATCYEEW